MREDGVVGGGCVEEDGVGGYADSWAVDLEEAPGPDVSVAEVGVVEGGEGGDAGEEGAGDGAEGVEEEVVYGGEEELWDC